ncbi:hypothetical protein QFZ60_001596 [Arthrobacter sp. B2I5]|uniref:hypothetical protein n=1 Tax=Arthrobacter sp. B2I5 TaxID=3042266 RepID=UPI002787EE53|nr:hypothetical protein [Arthrobacter sp. B2I5]MDQ0825423.1 hypothetical protein [Arthrobacter sp. B2I5]
MNKNSDKPAAKKQAKPVVTIAPQVFFSPVHGSVEAESLEEATHKLELIVEEQTNTKEEKVGDAK